MLFLANLSALFAAFAMDSIAPFATFHIGGKSGHSGVASVVLMATAVLPTSHGALTPLLVIVIMGKS